MKLFSSFPILVTLIIAFLVGFSNAGGGENSSFPTKVSSSPTELKFIGKSEAMLSSVCGAIPWPFRNLARSKIVKELQGLEEVTETVVYQVALKLTPSAHRQKTMELLNQFNTATPSI
jgi:hypothetical protein